MSTKRSYADGCAAAHALDLVGERWALLVVRELLLGPKRFSGLRRGLPGAAPNVVAQRLRDLEAAGVVRRRTLPPPVASQVYELTTWGLELEPVVRALGRWGSRSPGMDHDAPLSVDALVLAMRTLFAPARAAGLDATYALRVDDDAFTATVGGGEFRIVRGAGPADVAVTAAGTVLNEVIWGGQDLGAAVDDGLVRLDPDTETARRFFDLFPLPEPAAPAGSGR
ncbi:helix-turn-helix domain-containing protein [Jiangella sp. DSM 45060]|uniref:winged helix-turn-helix transcriptional regulator n=1 Tax=Jiangella sp. DSM 45060 TaxID=1798224 RepID=UPI00087D1BF3|nr:helix-turn-helix domain-containing protein [Jiangella sp. DSM 45060]SDT10401.1 DNA-binding transcriptional regulator, HxlR family [Jiangella sp. DSM 45060]